MFLLTCTRCVPLEISVLCSALCSVLCSARSALAVNCAYLQRKSDEDWKNKETTIPPPKCQDYLELAGRCCRPMEASRKEKNVVFTLLSSLTFDPIKFLVLGCSGPTAPPHTRRSTPPRKCRGY